MKYMILMYANEATAPKYSPEAYQAWQTLAGDAQAAGVLLSSSGFAPVANATTVRVRQGKQLPTDGPFAETHEMLT